jgi:long-chain acyl-CoA synthetase
VSGPNLAHLLAGRAATDPARPALRHEDGEVAYAELDRRAAAVAARLRERGVRPGDRVAILLPNAPVFVAALFGVLRAGAVAVPLNVLLRAPEVAARTAACGPRLALTDAERAPLAGDLDVVLLDDAPPDGGAAIAPRAAADPAVILFTSGTSGRPKGAVLSHGSIDAASRNAAAALALGPADVVLGAAPFSHVLGLATGLVATLRAGASVAVIGRFEPRAALARMTATRTTILLGVPTMCIALCQAARAAGALPPVRIAHVGGAALPVEVARDFERTFGGEVYEGYGLTELSGIATTYLPGQPRKAGSVGTPLGDTEMRVVSLTGAPLAPGEPGEVQFRGPSVIAGYWEDPAATAEALSPDGWLSTGDVGRIDADGYLFLVDRKKEMIIRGGYNVYPREVEEVLYAHPDVLEAAVVGVPDPELGEDVAALVVLRPGAELDPDVLRAWVRARVAAYKYPRRIVLVDDLPKGPTGKILKREIDPGRFA